MIKHIVKTRLFYRISEISVPLLSWLIITLPIWLSPFRPAVASYFILAFFLYFLYKTVKNVYYTAVSFDLINRASKVNWLRKLQKSADFEKIIHYIIITNYKESIEKIEKTLNHIKDQDYPKDKINIVLALEEFEGEEAKKRAEILKKKFINVFAGFFPVYHRLLPGEVIGKASNESHAGRFILKKTTEQKLNLKNILITVCDADSLLPKNYLSYLTFKYLEEKEKEFRFFWAPVLLYSNFWSLTLPIRVQAILSSILRLSFLSQKEDLIQISTYSTNLWLLKEVNFWDPDIIPEDWHIWLQAFFKFGEKVKTIPLYTPIKADAVLAKDLLNTFKNRYLQERRWAWGVTDIPYAIKRSFETPHIPIIPKIKKILLLVETHLLWPVSFFILTISSWIPSLINPVFRQTSIGFFLPKIASFILTITTIFLMFMIFFDHQMRKKVAVETKTYQIPFLFIQWYFLPIISFFFSSLPALDAHTRVLLGKKLEYKVTEKI